MAKEDVVFSQGAPAARIVFVTVNGHAGYAAGGGKMCRAGVQADKKCALLNQGKRLRDAQGTSCIYARSPLRHALFSHFLLARSSDDHKLASMGLKESSSHFDKTLKRPDVGRLFGTGRDGDYWHWVDGAVLGQPDSHSLSVLRPWNQDGCRKDRAGIEGDSIKPQPLKPPPSLARDRRGSPLAVARVEPLSAKSAKAEQGLDAAGLEEGTVAPGSGAPALTWGQINRHIKSLPAQYCQQS